MSQELLQESVTGRMAIPTDNDGKSLHGLEENSTTNMNIPAAVHDDASINIRAKGKGKQITVYNKPQAPSIDAEEQNSQDGEIIQLEKIGFKTPDIRSTRKRSIDKSTKAVIEQLEEPVDTPLKTIPVFSSQVDMKQTVQIDHEKDIPLKKRRHPDSPMKRPDSPMKMPDSPMKMPDSPMKMPDSPMKRPDSPMKRPDSPMKRPDSPLKRLNSPMKRLDSPIKRQEKLREMRKTSRTTKDTYANDKQNEVTNESQKKNEPIIPEELAIRILMQWHRNGVIIKGQKFRLQLIPDNQNPVKDTSYLEQHGFSPGQACSETTWRNELRNDALSGITEAMEDLAQVPALELIEQRTGDNPQEQWESEDPLDLTHRPVDLSMKNAAESQTDPKNIAIEDLSMENTAEGSTDYTYTGREDHEYQDEVDLQNLRQQPYIPNSIPLTLRSADFGVEMIDNSRGNAIDQNQRDEMVSGFHTEPMCCDNAGGDDLPSLEQGTQNITLTSRPTSSPNSPQIVQTDQVVSVGAEHNRLLQTLNQLSVEDLFNIVLKQQLQQIQSSTSSMSNATQINTTPMNVPKLDKIAEEKKEKSKQEYCGEQQADTSASMLFSLGLTTEDGSMAVTSNDKVKEKLSSMMKNKTNK